MTTKRNAGDLSNYGVGADGLDMSQLFMTGRRSDIFWDEDAGYWKNGLGEYDDEANDERPIGDKYKSYVGVQILLILVFIALLIVLHYVFQSIQNN